MKTNILEPAAVEPVGTDRTEPGEEVDRAYPREESKPAGGAGDVATSALLRFLPSHRRTRHLMSGKEWSNVQACGVHLGTLSGKLSAERRHADCGSSETLAVTKGPQQPMGQLHHPQPGCSGSIWRQ